MISIHALREEGDRGKTHPDAAGRHISIHALREEGDTGAVQSWKAASAFLSTPSARRATLPVGLFGPLVAISIHALREEGDRP